MEEEQRKAALNKNIFEATAIREMCQMPGFKILQARFDEKVRKATARLIDVNTTDDEVREIRKKVQIWTELTAMLKSLLITGEYSARILRDLDPDLDSTTTPIPLDRQGE